MFGNFSKNLNQTRLGARLLLDETDGPTLMDVGREDEVGRKESEVLYSCSLRFS